MNTRYKLRSIKKRKKKERKVARIYNQEAIYNLQKMLRMGRITQEEFDEKIKLYNERIKKV